MGTFESKHTEHSEMSVSEEKCGMTVQHSDKRQNN